MCENDDEEVNNLAQIILAAIRSPTDKLDKIVEDNLKLKTTVLQLQKKVKYLEKVSKRNNIVLYGVPEKEIDKEDLQYRILDIFNILSRKSKIEEWGLWEIKETRRLGKPLINKTRPILVALTRVWRKVEILRNRKFLPDKIHVTQDYPKDVLIKRKQLKKRMMHEQRKGKKAYIRYDKLVVEEPQTSLNIINISLLSPNSEIKPQHTNIKIDPTPNASDNFDQPSCSYVYVD